EVALPAGAREQLRRLASSPDRWPAWLTPRARASLDRWQADTRREASARRAPDPVQRHLLGALDGASELWPSLVRLDRFAARRGIDLRHPFYDVRVVETLLSTPAPLRAEPHGPGKRVLRDATRGRLPAVVA